MSGFVPLDAGLYSMRAQNKAERPSPPVDPGTSRGVTDVYP